MAATYKKGDFEKILADDLKPYLIELKECINAFMPHGKAEILGKYLLNDPSRAEDVLDIAVDKTECTIDSMYKSFMHEQPEKAIYGVLILILEKIRRRDLAKSLSRHMQENGKTDKDKVDFRTFSHVVGMHINPDNLTSLGIEFFGDIDTDKKIQKDIQRLRKQEPCSIILDAWIKEHREENADILMDGIKALKIAKVTQNVYNFLSNIRAARQKTQAAAAFGVDENDSPSAYGPPVPQRTPAPPGESLDELKQELEEARAREEYSEMYS